MPVSLDAESTLTDRYQTTVLETVRRALGLGKRDKIRYSICLDGEVVMTRAESAEGDDPVLGRFPDFLAPDMRNHPEYLQVLDSGMARRLQRLVAGVEVDLDAPLRADDE
ncbi:MAG: type II toxin-antitoxin system PrlF family antitoxin [Lautropia sp.]|nr:type II toxin-antitoxin system PrlF family antitoxin [Lautropia sp.]